MVVLIDLLAGFVRRLEGGWTSSQGRRRRPSRCSMKTLTFTSRSPLAVAVDRRESPATRRRTLPGCVPAAMFTRAFPPIVVPRRATDGCRYGDEEVVDEVIAVADEVGILFFWMTTCRSPGIPPRGARSPALIERNCMPAATLCRDAEGYDFFTDLRPFPRSYGQDDLARTLAGGADGLRLHHTEDCAERR